MRLNPENAVLDPRIRQYVRPARIVWQTDGAAAPRSPEALLEPGSGVCVLKNEGQAPGILLDFGREIHGGVQIRNGLTRDHRPIRVRVRFGESVSEAMGETDNDHAVHDQETLIPWYGYAEIGNTGFRFVRIDLVDPNCELRLEHVLAVFLYRDLEYRGSFHCSDERLNTIWQTGAYTVHLCMQDMLWDGIKRDRLVWIGDMHPETMTINSVFGNVDIVPQSLDFVRDDTPLPRWMNGISSYSMWWVLTHHVWYLYHGNREYLMAQRPYMIDLLKQLRDQIGPDGGERMGDHRFLDWPSSGDPSAIHAGLHGLLTMTMRAGAEVCEVMGEAASKQACLDAVSRLKGYSPPPTPSKQANALLALSGIADAQDINRRVLAQDPFHGLSTFYGYYVLEARAAARDYQGCLDVIRRFWGGMLDLGATTFWEDFNLAWTENAAGIDAPVPEGMKDIHADFGDYCYKGLRHSLCHGWASGPTAWMSRHVLGIAPVEPGFKTVCVDPHLGDLEFAEGTFPTPKGDIRVRHTKTASGAIESEVDLPQGMQIVPNVP